MSDLPPLIAAGVLSYYLLWSAAYVVAIITNARSRSYSLPYVSVAMCLAWEFLFSFVFRYPDPVVNVITMLWLVPDAIIFYQTMRYGPSEQTNQYMKKYFRALMIGIFIMSMISFYKFSTDFSDERGVLSSYILNLVISALYLGMVFRRPQLRGMSFAVTILKALGTFISALVVHVMYPDEGHHPFRFIESLFFEISIIDLFSIIIHAKRLHTIRKTSAASGGD